MSLTISLDYDDTFTADPKLWCQFVSLAQYRGHKVICVSARYDTEENRRELTTSMPDGVDVILCDHKAKLEVVRERGVEIDIWLDDRPEAVLYSHGSSEPFPLEEMSLVNQVAALHEECSRLRMLVDEERREQDSSTIEAYW